MLRLRNPAIVTLLDFSLEDDPPWLASEYARGSTLYDYLKERGSLPVEKLLAILKVLLGALDYAHGETVIHRAVLETRLLSGKTVCCLANAVAV